MKKALAVVLALMLVTLLGGWANPAAYQKYLEAETKMNEMEVTSVDMKMSGVVDVTDQDETIRVLFDMRVQVVELSETDFDMRMDMVLNLMGETVSSTSYYTDGYLYQEVMGLKYKTKLDMDFDESAASAQTVSIPRNAVITSDITEIPTGYRLNFVVDPKIPNIAVVDSVNTALLGGDFSYAIESLAYEIYVDGQDNITDYNMNINMKVAYEEIYYGMEYAINCKYVGLNTLSAIQFPADFGSYIEI